jgi:hypothetical protein
MPIVMVGLPTFQVAGLSVRPGDVLGRTKPGSIIEHRFLCGFDGAIYHVPEPGKVFCCGWLSDTLSDGDSVRIVCPTDSLQETQRRIARAKQLMGVPWWDMNCQQTTDYIVAPD